MILLRAPLTTLLAGLTLVAISCMVGLGRDAAWRIVLVGFVCACAAIVAKLPLARAADVDVERLPTVLLVSMILRGSLTALGLILLITLAGFRDLVTVIAAGLWYGAFLISESVVFCRQMASRYPSPTTDGAEKHRT